MSNDTGSGAAITTLAILRGIILGADENNNGKLEQQEFARIMSGVFSDPPREGQPVSLSIVNACNHYAATRGTPESARPAAYFMGMKNDYQSAINMLSSARGAELIEAMKKQIAESSEIPQIKPSELPQVKQIVTERLSRMRWAETQMPEPGLLCTTAHGHATTLRR